MKTRSIHFRKQGLNLRTREEWLQRMLDALRPCFDKIGHPIPDQVRVSCSWPSQAVRSRSRRRVGECWCAAASADQTVEIFISPCLGDGHQAAECLAHEMVHATGALGHRREFSKIAMANRTQEAMAEYAGDARTESAFKRSDFEDRPLPSRDTRCLNDAPQERWHSSAEGGLPQSRLWLSHADDGTMDQSRAAHMSVWNPDGDG